jgi:hypothetical protein
MTEDDKLKLGYQATLSFVVYEGQLIWRSFLAMLVANAFVAAVAGLAPQFLKNGNPGAGVLSVVGLIICVAWFLVVRRQFAYYRYWFSWLRHFEAISLQPEVRITTLGRTYGDGGSVGGDRTTPNLPRFPWAARVFRAEWLIAIIIAAFAVLYGFIFVNSLCHGAAVNS